MFGSIYVGLSGLDAYSRGLKQVSNNVANLNSQGFKASTISFRDVSSARASDGASFASARGSVGNGVSNADTRLSMASGELRQTERDLDLSVDGNGFLMLMRGDETVYTRTGSFEVNKDGHIVLAGTDYRLATLDARGSPTAISIDASRTSAPKATSKVVFSENLSSGASSYSVSNVKVIDKLGGEHVWKVTFTRDTSVPGQWSVTVTNDQAETLGPKTLKFINGVADPSTARLDFTDSDAGLAVALDLTNVTSFSAGEISTVRAASTDGYRHGAISSLAVNEKGELEAGYSNAQKVQLGAVAVVDFRDPQALTQRSGGLFIDGGAAGAHVLRSGDATVGTVKSRRLEASNVDLSKEFGDLILIQRGFQASSQIISVANDMIQQLFGIRGQG